MVLSRNLLLFFEKKTETYDMEVYVNQQPLDFELSQVIPLNQVLEHVQNWAGSQNYFILDYKALKSDHSVTIEQATLSSEIARLDIELGSQVDLLKENAQELCQMLDRYGQSLAYEIGHIGEGDSNLALDKYREGLNVISESGKGLQNSLRSLVTVDFIKAISHVDTVLAERAISHQQAVDLLGALSVLKENGELIYRKLKTSNLNAENYQQFLAALQEQKSTIVEKIEAVASALTVGENHRAFTLIEDVIEFITDVVQTLQYDQAQKQFCEKIMKTLEELTQALGNSDAVTAADIVDFDIREILESL